MEVIYTPEFWLAIILASAIYRFGCGYGHIKQIVQARNFAINNTAFDIGVMLIAGVVAYLLEQNDFPISPLILGVVLGGMLEENLVSSLIKSDGSVLAFFERPIAATLGVVTLLIWLSPLLRRWRRRG